VDQAWETEKACLRPTVPLPARLRPALPLRQVSKDGFVHLRTNRYSVPWKLCGTQVSVRAREGQLEILRDETLVARHDLCQGRYQTILDPTHHQDMPLGPETKKKKAKLHLVAGAPTVSARDLSYYEEVAA
jgi:hypothetical protein